MGEEGEERCEAMGEEEEEAPAPAAPRPTTFAELVEACDAMGVEGAHQDPGRIGSGYRWRAVRRDVIGVGKTAAFALLEHRQRFFACVLAPTRELAIQIAKQFEALGSAIGLQCSVLVGGIPRTSQTIPLAKRPHVVVLDEANDLLEVEFQKAVDDILNVIPKERRTFLSSATMTDKGEKTATCLPKKSC